MIFDACWSSSIGTNGAAPAETDDTAKPNAETKVRAAKRIAILRYSGSAPTTMIAGDNSPEPGERPELPARARRRRGHPGIRPSDENWHADGSTRDRLRLPWSPGCVLGPAKPGDPYADCTSRPSCRRARDRAAVGREGAILLL